MISVLIAEPLFQHHHQSQHLRLHIPRAMFRSQHRPYPQFVLLAARLSSLERIFVNTAARYLPAFRCLRTAETVGSLRKVWERQRFAPPAEQQSNSMMNFAIIVARYLTERPRHLRRRHRYRLAPKSVHVAMPRAEPIRNFAASAAIIFRQGKASCWGANIGWRR